MRQGQNTALTSPRCRGRAAAGAWLRAALHLARARSALCARAARARAAERAPACVHAWAAAVRAGKEGRGGVLRRAVARWGAGVAAEEARGARVGGAAHRTLVRARALRRWVAYMRAKGGQLALLLQGQTLYRRQLMAERWASWIDRARENVLLRGKLARAAERRARSALRGALGAWRPRAAARALLRRVFSRAETLWRLRAAPGASGGAGQHERAFAALADAVDAWRDATADAAALRREQVRVW